MQRASGDRTVHEFDLSVLDRAEHRPVRYRKSQVVYDEGEISDSIYRIDRGCVRLQIAGMGGTRQILRFAFRGDLFGICPTRRNAAAEAVTDLELTRFSLKSVLELTSMDPTITLMLMNEASQAYGELARRTERLSRLTAVERVRWFFDTMARRRTGVRPGPSALPMSFKDIADYLGLTPETMSRSMKIIKDGSAARPG